MPCRQTYSSYLHNLKNATHTHTYIYTPLLRIIFALVCVSVWYHLGPQKQKRKSTLMTAIRRSCSCTYIHIYSDDGHSPQGEREKKIVK